MLRLLVLGTALLYLPGCAVERAIAPTDWARRPGWRPDWAGRPGCPRNLRPQRAEGHQRANGFSRRPGGELRVWSTPAGSVSRRHVCPRRHLVPLQSNGTISAPRPVPWAGTGDGAARVPGCSGAANVEL